MSLHPPQVMGPAQGIKGTLDAASQRGKVNLSDEFGALGSPLSGVKLRCSQYVFGSREQKIGIG